MMTALPNPWINPSLPTQTRQEPQPITTTRGFAENMALIEALEEYRAIPPYRSAFDLDQFETVAIRMTAELADIVNGLQLDRVAA